jgi:3-deoxy-D-arabino-heptulosonate 7-phosphate (DAHP) synthase
MINRITGVSRMVLSLGIFMDSNISTWLWRAERVISQGTRKFVLGNVGVLNFLLPP